MKTDQQVAYVGSRLNSNRCTYTYIYIYTTSWTVWRKRSSIENRIVLLVFRGIYRSIGRFPRANRPRELSRLYVTWAVQVKESQGKRYYATIIFISWARSVENKPGVSYVTKNIMVDVLFTDSIKGADGNIENSFKETIPTGLTLSVDYYRVIIVRPLRTTK